MAATSRSATNVLRRRAVHAAQTLENAKPSRHTPHISPLKHGRTISIRVANRSTHFRQRCSPVFVTDWAYPPSGTIRPLRARLQKTLMDALFVLVVTTTSSCQRQHAEHAQHERPTVWPNLVNTFRPGWCQGAVRLNPMYPSHWPNRTLETHGSASPQSSGRAALGPWDALTHS